jgi:ABC-type transport system involved in cytochrome c biogenesis permease component
MNINEQLSKYRIDGYSVFHTILTFLGLLLISPITKKYFNIDWKQLFLLALPLTILSHVLFNIDSPLNDRFFNPTRHYAVKAVVIYLTYKGLTYNSN